MSELISVIIPMYNVEDYISNCLDSVISQTYKNIEIILVNDGSFDNTLYICERYAKDDNRIKIFTQENKGVSSARNFALRNVCGKYFLFVDADDFIGENHVENLYNNLVRNNVDICVGTYTEITMHNAKITLIENLKKFSHILTKEESILKMVYRNGFGGESVSKLFSTSLMRKHNILFDVKQKVGEDFTFCCLMFKYAESISFCEENSYFYLRRQGSATRNSVVNALNRLRSANKYQDFILENYPYLYVSSLYYYCFCYLEVINSILDFKNIKKYNKLLQLLKLRLRCKLSKLIFVKNISISFKVKILLASINISLYSIFRNVYLKIKNR